MHFGKWIAPLISPGIRVHMSLLLSEKFSELLKFYKDVLLLVHITCKRLVNYAELVLVQRQRA